MDRSVHGGLGRPWPCGWAQQLWQGFWRDLNSSAECVGAPLKVWPRFSGRAATLGRVVEGVPKFLAEFFRRACRPLKIPAWIVGVPSKTWPII